MIHSLINTYNEAIQSAITSARAKIMGLAQPVYIIDEDEQTIPMLTVNGEDAYVFIDDEYDFGIYHKLNSKTYTNEQNKGFGDAAKILCTSDFSMVVWCFENNFSADELEQFIVKNTPEGYRIYSTNFDKKTVFNQEFSKIDFELNEVTQMFKINYRVTYKVDKSCIETNTNI